MLLVLGDSWLPAEEFEISTGPMRSSFLWADSPITCDGWGRRLSSFFVQFPKWSVLLPDWEAIYSSLIDMSLIIVLCRSYRQCSILTRSGPFVLSTARSDSVLYRVQTLSFISVLWILIAISYRQIWCRRRNLPFKHQDMKLPQYDSGSNPSLTFLASRDVDLVPQGLLEGSHDEKGKKHLLHNCKAYSAIMVSATFSLTDTDELIVTTRFEVPSVVLTLDERSRESAYVCPHGGLWWWLRKLGPEKSWDYWGWGCEEKVVKQDAPGLTVMTATRNLGKGVWRTSEHDYSFWHWARNCHDYYYSTWY